MGGGGYVSFKDDVKAELITAEITALVADTNERIIDIAQKLCGSTTTIDRGLSVLNLLTMQFIALLSNNATEAQSAFLKEVMKR